MIQVVLLLVEVEVFLHLHSGLIATLFERVSPSLDLATLVTFRVSLGSELVDLIVLLPQLGEQGQ